jgi:ubiquinone/menaquinone biosynthesis C-methylase UbiE
LSRPRRVSLAEGYRLWSETYDELNPLHILEERVLLPRLPNLQGKVAFDVACGTGRWLRRLLAQGAQAAFAADLSAEMLAQAARHSTAGHLLRADCRALPLRDLAADVIVCSLAIGHISGPAKLARELARIARPGADVFLSDFHPAAHARDWRRAFRSGEELVQVPSLAHSLEAVLEAFRCAGFQVVRCEEPYIGEPERDIFAGLGKLHLFDAACETPVFYIFHFRAPLQVTSEEK